MSYQKMQGVFSNKLFYPEMLSQYAQAARAAMAPSEAAVVSCRTVFVLPSPAVKIPAALVLQSPRC